MRLSFLSGGRRVHASCLEIPRGRTRHAPCLGDGAMPHHDPQCHWLFALAACLPIIGCATTVSDRSPPAPNSSVQASKADAEAPPDVGLRLFVVETEPPSGKSDALPPALKADPGVCPDSDCRLVASPVLLGRSGFPMKLELGDSTGGRTLSAEIRVRNPGSALLDVNLDLSLFGDGGRKHAEYTASVPPGELVHLGTLNDENQPGPSIFGVFASGGSEDLRQRLQPWMD